jgi:steroid delta-isomerase-like uncharacterized protein
MPDSTQRIVDLVTELWNTGSSKAAEQLYVSHGRRLDPNTPDAVSGPQAILAYVAAVRKAFPDFKLTVTGTMQDGDRLIAEWSAVGTHHGEYLGIPATGKIVRISGVALNRIAEGRIVEEKVYFDRAAMLEQLGVLPTQTVGRAAAS